MGSGYSQLDADVNLWSQRRYSLTIHLRNANHLVNQHLVN